MKLGGGQDNPTSSISEINTLSTTSTNDNLSDFQYSNNNDDLISIYDTTNYTGLVIIQIITEEIYKKQTNVNLNIHKSPVS